MQNFGQIHETYKAILANGIVDNNDKYKKVFNTYVKALKENIVLKTQYKIFNKIENKNINENEKSKIFIDECVSLLKNLNESDYDVDLVNKKLVDYLENKGFKLLEDYENKELYQHIHNLAFTNKNSNNIDSIIESKLFLTNYSKPISEGKELVEPYMNKVIGPVMVEKFNEKYKGVLSETEKQAFKVIQSGNEEDKISLYKNTIIECLDLINEKLDNECTIQEKDKYLQVKDKLLRYNYKSENFISEMSKIAYLKDTLK